MRRRCEKSDSAARVGGRGGVPEELLESVNRYDLSEFAKASGTPCPLRAGGGGSTGYRLFRRPPSLGWGVWVLDCEFMALCLGLSVLVSCLFGSGAGFRV